VGWPKTPLTELLGIRYPIVQAPMAGSTTPELVAAVSNAGGLGALGGSTLDPEGLRAEIRRIRELTDRPFAINLFAPHDRPEPSAETVAAVDRVLAPWRAELGLPEPARHDPIAPPDPYEEQAAVVLEERVPVFSFTFGLPPLSAYKEAGTIVLGTVTTPEEAEQLAAAGVDAVVAQGSEAGGHRGTFAGPFEEALVGTLALVPQVADRVRVPVVAAGGIGDGRGIAAVLALGAAGAQVGTAFLTCPEARVPEAYRQAILGAPATATAVSNLYSGRPARLIRTGLIAALEESSVEPAPFPAQAALLWDLREAGTERGLAELLFLLAGQAAGLARPLPAGDLVERLADETAGVLRRLT
jgi:nitronate monooxygenase